MFHVLTKVRARWFHELPIKEGRSTPPNKEGRSTRLYKEGRSTRLYKEGLY